MARRQAAALSSAAAAAPSVPASAIIDLQDLPASRAPAVTETSDRGDESDDEKVFIDVDNCGDGAHPPPGGASFSDGQASPSASPPQSPPPGPRKGLALVAGDGPTINCLETHEEDVAAGEVAASVAADVAGTAVEEGAVADVSAAAVTDRPAAAIEDDAAAGVPAEPMDKDSADYLSAMGVDHEAAADRAAVALQDVADPGVTAAPVKDGAAMADDADSGVRPARAARKSMPGYVGFIFDDSDDRILMLPPRRNGRDANGRQGAQLPRTISKGKRSQATKRRNLLPRYLARDRQPIGTQERSVLWWNAADTCCEPP